MSVIIKIENLKKIHQAAKSFIKKMDDAKVYSFNGNMGVGNTTFIKAICEELCVNQIVNSPTFSIVNEYETADGKIIYHFDCYRINKIQEALDLGAEEYLYSGNYCFIEWSENIAPLLPDSLTKVNITEQPDGSRVVEII